MHAPELQEVRPVRERAPQSCSARGQHAPAVHQAVLADEHTLRERKPHCEHRRDVLPFAGASDRVGPPRRQTSSAAGTTFTVAFSMDRGPLDMQVQIVHAGKTDAVFPELPWPKHTHHVTSENGWANTTTILQLAATVHDVMNPGREGQSWILFWDMASIHASVATLAAMKAAFPSRRVVLHPATKHVVPCIPATWPSSPASRAASRRRRAPLLPAPSSMTPSKAWP